MESSANNQYSNATVKKTLQVLYPSRFAHNSLKSTHKQRFSQLLLEHGERHLQDWAVVASSSAIDTSSSSASKCANGRLDTNRAERVRRVRSNASSTHQENVPPSICMGIIDGRLRLCSRSVVLEPNDPTRGIIRCPFERMNVAPYRSDDMDSSNTAIVICSRHAVMKTNNVIAPYETIEVLTEFRFSFLHSNPQKFFDLSKTLYGMVKSKDPKQSSAKALDEIIRPMLDRTFDLANFLSVRENALSNNLQCSLLTPLLSQAGCSIVTNERVYFQPVLGAFSSVASKAMNWALSDISSTARRYHGLKDCAVELFFASGPSVLLAYKSPREREQVMRLLPRKNVPCHTDREFVLKVVETWKSGEISNFDYLLALNSAAGRTFHDFSRYPVFPWVIADYKSSKLDWTDKDNTYRDLTKPIGALNEERLEHFKERLEGMQDMDQPFLYGTHYSAPGYVLFYLVRSMPEHMLCLQNGKYDTADRLFFSMQHTYSCLMSNQADVKELIPEFYDTSAGFDFLINARGLQFGPTQTGVRVNDVQLPPWARSARDFIKKNRKALESDVVTQTLPRWIDLIFGEASRGANALDAWNLFHPTAYLVPEDIEAMSTEEERMHAEMQAMEFGIVPDMIFCQPHPLRSDQVDVDLCICPDAGRALFFEESDDADEAGSTANKDPWELLDGPKRTFGEGDQQKTSQTLTMPSPQRTEFDSSLNANVGTMHCALNERHILEASNSPPSQTFNHDKLDCKPDYGMKLSQQNDPHTAESDLGCGASRISNSFQSSFNGSVKSLSLRGTGDPSRGIETQPLTGSGSFREDGFESTELHESEQFNSSASPSRPGPSENHQGWELKPITSKRMHGDAVSGCCLFLQSSAEKNLYVATVSLDGSLMVHTLTLSQKEVDIEPKRRGFSGASSLRGFSYFRGGAEVTQPKFHLLRSHASADPLACLSVIGDGKGGFVIFAGSHDDVVLAYGIDSACALASIYCHRDAVTGIDLVSNPFFSKGRQSTNASHIMASGSWDATVKLWSVSLSQGENVSIDREPLAELFDADNSIKCIAVTEVEGLGVVITAGCSDGGFVVWLWNDNEAKKTMLLYKEEPRRGVGSCLVIKTITGKTKGEIVFIVGFGNGRIVSYVMKDRLVRPISKLHLGSSVQCLHIEANILLAGCADGGLRLIPVVNGTHFDFSPRLWGSVTGSSSSGITSICAASSNNSCTERSYTCAIGAEDGIVALFEIEGLP